MRAFVDQFLVECVSASDEAHVLLELSSAVSGAEAVGAIGERLLAALGSAEFETELRRGPDMAHVRLRRLNVLRIRVETSSLDVDTRAKAMAALERIEGLIQADAPLVDSRRRSQATVVGET